MVREGCFKVVAVAGAPHEGQFQRALAKLWRPLVRCPFLGQARGRRRVRLHVVDKVVDAPHGCLMQLSPCLSENHVGRLLCRRVLRTSWHASIAQAFSPSCMRTHVVVSMRFTPVIRVPQAAMPLRCCLHCCQCYFAWHDEASDCVWLQRLTSPSGCVCGHIGHQPL